MKRHLTLAIAITLAVPWLSFAQTAITYPEPQYVSDYANVLSAEEENALAEKVLQFRQETSNEIAVLVIPTTEPETIEQYSIHVTDKWKIGEKGKDNGLLLTVAVNDRAMRLEVGRGLEGAIPDITATKILDAYARPAFKEGKFYEGINAALDQTMALAKGEFNEADIPETTGAASGENDGLFSFIFYAAIGGFSFFTNYLAKSKSWWFGGIAGGVAAFVVALLLSTGVIVAVFLAGIFGIFGLIVDYIVSKNYGKTGTSKNNWWWFGGGGGSSGGGWGSGGGGFGGGGFSGGGGSSRW